MGCKSDFVFGFRLAQKMKVGFKISPTFVFKFLTYLNAYKERWRDWPYETLATFWLKS